TVERGTVQGASDARAEDWTGLYRRCATATPFQRHAWLSSWWHTYGRPGDLRLLLVRTGGELVAAAPLMRVRRPWPALVTLGGAVSDYGDVLLDDAHGRAAAAALTGALAAAARTALIALREVRSTAADERALVRRRGRRPDRPAGGAPRGRRRAGPRPLARPPAPAGRLTVPGAARRADGWAGRPAAVGKVAAAGAGQAPQAGPAGRPAARGPAGR